MARVWYWSSRLLPNGWLDALRQLALFAAAYYLYRLVRGLVDGKAAAAFANARDLVEIERSIGLFFEPHLQAWALGSAGVLIDGANWMYVNSHFMITIGFIVWLYLARNESFYFVRNMFMVAMGLALVGYALFPTAPPRFFPEWGFTDTVESFLGESASSSANVLYNPFAAVPSMHVAFALMIGLPAAKLVKSRVVSGIWLCYPAVVTAVVVLTANHFWLDAALGAMVAALSAWVASAGLAKLRPHAWAWRTPGGARAPGLGADAPALGAEAPA